MPIVLSSEQVGAALIKIKKAPKDQDCMMAFLNLTKPIVKMTCERFPTNLSDDIGQEIRIHLMSKAVLLADNYMAGKIDNITNYLFRTCYNAATTYIKKENKHRDRLVPIDDIKIEPAIYSTSNKKHKIIDRVRQKTLDFIRVRFTQGKDRIRAEKYVGVILTGQRPCFMTKDLIKFYGGRQGDAKQVYSIVLHKIRELLRHYYEDLLSR